MQSNIPRAAIHVGKDKKSFSAQVGNEAERRGWDENVYRLKNADKEKNNHYNFSRKNLNFEIVKDGKIVPLGSNPIPLHERIQMRLDELGFKPYMDAKHPDQEIGTYADPVAGGPVLDDELLQKNAEPRNND